MKARAHLYLLGRRWRLLLPDGQEFQQPMPLLLLSYLHFHPQTSRKQLVRLFWPGESSSTAQRKKLSDTLRSLRKLSVPVLEESADYERLGASLVSDVALFQDDLDQDHVLQALTHYQGPLLHQIEENQKLAFDQRPELLEWLLEKRNHFSMLALEAGLECGEQLAMREQYAHAADVAWQAFRALGSSGVLLDQDIQRLYTVLLAAQDVRAASLRRTLKEQAMQPLSLPRNWQEARSLLKSHHNLPVSVPLIGREEIMEQTLRLLHDPSVRLITFSGPPGVGKSSLALAVAKQLLGKRTYLDGIYLITLTEATTETVMLKAIAHAMQLTGVVSVEQLSQQLQHRQLLLILDDMDHLITAKMVVPTLMETCLQLRCFVTSRERLGLSGEHLITLTGLAYPWPEDVLAHPKATVDVLEISKAKEARAANRAKEGVEETLDLDIPLTLAPLNKPVPDDHPIFTYAAVVLFCKTAERLSPTFSLQEGDLEALVTICTYTQGWPLALRLAATWAGSISLNAIAKEMQVDIHFLSQSVQPQMHQSSMFAACDYSYKLLNSKYQQAYRQFSLFEGGANFAAAQKIIGISPLVLRGLVDRSLLVHHDKTERFGLVPLLRLHAAFKLSEYPDEYTTVSQAHADYYFGTFENPQTGWMHTATPEALYAESANLHQAWRWLISTKQPHVLLAGVRFWEVIHQVKAGPPFGYEQLVADEGDIYQQVPPSPARKLLLARIKAMKVVIGQEAIQDQKAIETLEPALAVFQEQHDPIWQSQTQSMLGSLHHNIGNTTKAQYYYEQAIETAPSPAERLLPLGNIALLFLQTGELDKAYQAGLEACACAEYDRLRLPWAHYVLAGVLDDMGREAEAEEAYHTALYEAREQKQVKYQLYALEALIHLYVQKGELALAYTYVNDAIELAKSQKEYAPILTGLYITLIMVLTKQEEYDLAWQVTDTLLVPDYWQYVTANNRYRLMASLLLLACLSEKEMLAKSIVAVLVSKQHKAQLSPFRKAHIAEIIWQYRPMLRGYQALSMSHFTFELLWQQGVESLQPIKTSLLPLLFSS